MFAVALRSLYAYNAWATGRILAAAAPLTPEQLNAPGQAGRGSIRDTLIHQLDAHQGWLSWWDGSKSAEEAYASRLDPDALPDVAALERQWQAIDRQMSAFLASLTDDDMARPYGFDLPNGQHLEMPLWGMLLHIANHNTQHRTEAAAMLTEFGHSPGDLDLIFFLMRAGADQPRA